MGKYPNRRSIWIGPELQALLEQRGMSLDAELEGFSPFVNTIADRYRRIVDDAMPTLSVAEWCATFDANNGVTPDFNTASNLWANVADSPELAGKWDINVEYLSGKLQCLSLAGRIAVADACDRFWQRVSAGTDNRGTHREQVESIVGAAKVSP